MCLLLHYKTPIHYSGVVALYVQVFCYYMHTILLLHIYNTYTVVDSVRVYQERHCNIYYTTGLTYPQCL